VNNGLGAGNEVFGGLPSTAFGLDADHGAAFAGRNPLVGTGLFLVPNGRSTYTALQMKLQQRMENPLPGFHNVNFQVAYSLSQFNNMVGVDQDFSGNAIDNANPGRFYGPSSLDRKHQLSWGGSFQAGRKGPQLGFIGHIFSPLAVTPTLPLDPGGAEGEIFRTDFTGDGTTGDIMPGTNIGSIGRKYNGSNINDAISRYNALYAGKPTPAGQVLINNGLFTEQQLVELGMVAPSVQFAPDDQLKMSWLKTIDLRMDWPIKVNERFTLHPTVAMYNAFNFANYNTSASLLSGVLDGAGSVNGTPKSDTGTVDSLRSKLGTGTNGFGSPRAMEFGLRLVF
jgi:hypothetical protein